MGRYPDTCRDQLLEYQSCYTGCTHKAAPRMETGIALLNANIWSSLEGQKVPSHLLKTIRILLAIMLP
ncbi:hypothetical protein H920_13845 [Fukomys damarensis]|uniref:Uncharacterized protein n=1 Tax=Fukomys damarensis TaxID=885580 RepID=A0A091D3J5_FUKDA|nr:hypothetical protein H920_13845 [Fukomys damarensis]